PERRFCRRCGNSLVEAAVAPAPEPPLPWWRRLFRRQAKVHAAGDRPMRKGGGRTGTGRSSALARGVRMVLMVAVVLAVLGMAGPWRSSVGDAFQSVRRLVAPRFDPVNPIDPRATSELRPAGLAIDIGDNTSWAESAPGNGEGQVLTFTFEQPVDLARIGFAPGAAGEEFLAQPRPQDLHVVFSNASTGQAVPVATKDLSLKEVADLQFFGVDAKGVTQVDIEIRSAYPGQQGHDLAITDIQFFEKN
ncbi:MAG: NADase-type glycan-binding domain-containing protein, partial [Acidimicrobiales bacterium]